MTADADTLIYLGDAVKSLGSGRVGGYLVRFGTAETPDVQGDFFDGGTYFGAHIPGRVDAYYHHGLRRHGDPYADEFGNDPIGVADVKTLPDGYYAETTLDISRPAVAKLYAEFERGGYLGYSSGSDSRLVKYEPVKANVRRIARWPINDVTLSPTPVDRRNRAVPIKSLLDDAADPAPLVARAETLVADVEAIVATLKAHAEHRRAEGRSLSPAKRDALKAMLDAMSELHAATAPRPDPAQLDRLKRRLLAGRI